MMTYCIAVDTLQTLVHKSVSNVYVGPCGFHMNFGKSFNTDSGVVSSFFIECQYRVTGDYAKLPQDDEQEEEQRFLKESFIGKSVERIGIRKCDNSLWVGFEGNVFFRAYPADGDPANLDTYTWMFTIFEPEPELGFIVSKNMMTDVDYGLT